MHAEFLGMPLLLENMLLWPFVRFTTPDVSALACRSNSSACRIKLDGGFEFADVQLLGLFKEVYKKLFHERASSPICQK